MRCPDDLLWSEDEVTDLLQSRAIDTKAGITLRRTLLVSFQRFSRELDGVRLNNK